jgi:hypothetical protein
MVVVAPWLLARVMEAATIAVATVQGWASRSVRERSPSEQLPRERRTTAAAIRAFNNNSIRTAVPDWFEFADRRAHPGACPFDRNDVALAQTECASKISEGEPGRLISMRDGELEPNLPGLVGDFDAPVPGAATFGIAAPQQRLRGFEGLYSSEVLPAG